jgi:hypothetical protein
MIIGTLVTLFIPFIAAKNPCIKNEDCSSLDFAVETSCIDGTCQALSCDEEHVLFTDEGKTTCTTEWKLVTSVYFKYFGVEMPSECERTCASKYGIFMDDETNQKVFYDLK